MSRKQMDVTGMRFGRLEVIGKVDEKDKHGRQLWLCKCDCGNEKKAYSIDMSSGRVKSCGCLLSEFNDNRQEHGWVEGTSLKNLEQKMSKVNTSGFKGVSFDKKSGKWMAYLMIKGKTKTIGRFYNIKDAVTARAEAEERYFKPILDKYDKPK